MPYKSNINGIQLRLTELQANNQQAKAIRAKTVMKEGWQDVNKVLHFESLPYISVIICIELISRYYNNPLAGHFGIKKTKELIT